MGKKSDKKEKLYHVAGTISFQISADMVGCNRAEVERKIQESAQEMAETFQGDGDVEPLVELSIDLVR